MSTNLYDDSLLTILAVVVAVAVVIDNEQSIDDESTCYGSDEYLPGACVQLYVVGDADGYDAKEYDDQQVAHTDIG